MIYSAYIVGECFTAEDSWLHWLYIAVAKPYSSSIRLSVWVQCSGGEKHRHTQAKQTKQSGLTQHRRHQTAAFPLAVYSLKCLVSSFFPLLAPCSKAWKREKCSGGGLLNPCRAERWGEAGGETHTKGGCWGWYRHRRERRKNMLGWDMIRSLIWKGEKTGVGRNEERGGDR